MIQQKLSDDKNKLRKRTISHTRNKTNQEKIKKKNMMKMKANKETPMYR